MRRLHKTDETIDMDVCWKRVSCIKVHNDINEKFKLIVRL